ncbi:Forkhead box protein R1 [Lemmus lemmus]
MPQVFEEAPSTPASLCTGAGPSPLSFKVDPRLQDQDFWASLHGQVPGLLDWDMGNECFLSFTTSHLPKSIQERPDIKPNLWMWVDPNIVYPPGKLEVRRPKRVLKEEEASCSEASGAQPRLPTASQPSPPHKRKKKQKHIASSPSTWEELTEEEEAKDQDDSSSVALPSLPTRAPLQSRRRLGQAISPEGRLWFRPPLNYFHLIALALRNSAPCGINVQQIYSFIRKHFPFFRTAPEGWKNTIRHNLCFRDSFEKVPVSMQCEAHTQPRSCLWKLTEEGHRRFAEETRTLASTRLESIQQCMSQPGVKPCYEWAQGWGT